MSYGLDPPSSVDQWRSVATVPQNEHSDSQRFSMIFIHVPSILPHQSRNFTLWSFLSKINPHRSSKTVFFPSFSHGVYIKSRCWIPDGSEPMTPPQLQPPVLWKASHIKHVSLFDALIIFIPLVGIWWYLKSDWDFKWFESTWVVILLYVES